MQQNKELRNTNENTFKIDIDKIKRIIRRGLAIKIACDFSKGLISTKSKVFEFADIQDFLLQLLLIRI